MGKYANDAKELLKLLGGKSNIAAVTHCITRMRFALANPAKADIKGIEALKSVKGTFTQSGQFQVIIGNDVADFYKDFVAIAGIEGVSKDQVKQAAKKNQNFIQRIMTAIAEIFAPLIPAIVVGGLILGFRNCIDSLQICENGTKTLCDISQFWAGVDHFLWLIGEAIFHMLPVGICWSVTRKMGTTQILGIILGLTLVSGQLLNAYGVSGTAAADIPKWDFGFIQVNMIGYQAQVIPAILAGFTLVYLEKFFKKISPAVISMIIVPFFSLILSVMAAHFILGPIGWKIGEAISSVVYAGITGSLKVIFGGIFGLVYAPLVITGLHHMSNAIDLQLIADYGGTMLWPMIALSNIAQGSAVLGMIILQKKKASAQEVNIPACISCYLGVTEPAMFGVNLKYVFPFVSAIIGSGLAAIFCVATSTTANAIGVGGIPGILSIQAGSWLTFAIAMVIAIAVPMVLTIIIGKKKLAKEDILEIDENDTVAIAAPAVEMVAPVSGKVISVEEVNDGVFSAGTMGKGIGIIPSDGTVVSPADGIVTTVIADSKHAIGLSLANGADVLIHVGLDTVNMKGDGFSYLVNEGQEVKAGTPLIKFDSAKIKAAGYKDTVIIVVPEEGNAAGVDFVTGVNAAAGKTSVASFK